MNNLLVNGGFESAWDGNHRCILITPSGELLETNIGNIFTPPGWITWFRHDPGTWDQPEARDSWLSADPVRVRSGNKAMLLFTFFRKHDAGFLQQVQVVPGTKLRLTAWAHAWSNHLPPELGGHPHDPRWSDGAGYLHIAWEAGTLPSDTGDPQEDAMPNFTFYVGIDPTGGINPLADTVTWGTGYHVYNKYVKELSAEATAEADVVTVFLRSATLWPFNHNDAYWDDALLVGELPDRGKPRVQYPRSYVLLPPGANIEMIQSMLGVWSDHRFTIGASADDAGIGDLDTRRAIAINPDSWADDLEAFFTLYYPGAKYVPVECTTATVGPLLRQVFEGEPPPPPPPPPPSSVLLWQCDPIWRDKRYAGGRCDTFCAKGCWICCCAMAQRKFGIDPGATPETVDALLGSDGYTSTCLMTWGAMEAHLGIKVLQHTTHLPTVDAHLDAGNICFAEVEPLSLMHFVMVTRHENGRYWMLDPWKNVEGWLDEQYSGVDSWRLIVKTTEPPPPPPPPPPTRETRGHIGPHLQTMEVGWRDFVQTRLPVAKVFSLQDVIGVLRESPGTLVVFRHCTNDYGETLENPDPYAGARKWISYFGDSMGFICDRIASEFPNMSPPFFYVESVNECMPSRDEAAVVRNVLFDIAFCDELQATGLPVAAAVFCAAVGNPHETEYRLLLPLARKCQEVGGAMGYHGYWLANADYGGPDHLWKYLAGRWAEMDETFTAEGIYVKWYGGEGGAVGGVSGVDASLYAQPGGFYPRHIGPSFLIQIDTGIVPQWVHLLPHDGWISQECYGADWERYLIDIMRADELIWLWNQSHGDRFLGYVLFTTGADYTGWPMFQIREAQMRPLKAAILERYG